MRTWSPLYSLASESAPFKHSPEDYELVKEPTIMVLSTTHSESNKKARGFVFIHIKVGRQHHSIQ